MRKQCKLLFDRLQSNPPPWSDVHTFLVKQIKSHVKTLPCLGIPTVDAFKIVETDASDIGYVGILKQRVSPDSSKQIVHFYSGIMQHIFARWQAILSVFYFDIEYIKGSQNIIPDFLTHEFLQCHHGK